jgi:hypothetical protein
MSIVLFDHAGIGVADRDGGSDLTKCSARQLFCWRVYPPHVGPSRNNLGVVLCQDGSTFRDRVPYSAHRPIVDTGGRSPGTKRGASADRGTRLQAVRLRLGALPETTKGRKRVADANRCL